MWGNVEGGRTTPVASVSPPWFTACLTGSPTNSSTGVPRESDVRQRPSTAEQVLERLHLAAEAEVGLEPDGDLLARRQHGGVVLVAEGAAEVRVALAGELAGQIHGDGARTGDRLVAALALEVEDLDVVVVGDGLEDVLDRQVVDGAGDDAGQRLAREVE